MKLIVIYALLALIATAANIGTQDIVGRVHAGPFALVLAMLAGTAVGLLVKYMLDKRYIFRFRTNSLRHDGRTFALYTLMGLATTLIFWSFELGFNILFASPGMRYLGAGLGLGIGYVAKFNLDKRYVFLRALNTTK